MLLHKNPDEANSYALQYNIKLSKIYSLILLRELTLTPIFVVLAV